MNIKTSILAFVVLNLLACHAYASESECKKLKNDHDIIYAAKGFCFKDDEAKKKFGNENCNTSSPKFSEKEQQRLDDIKARQKELNCKALEK